MAGRAKRAVKKALASVLTYGMLFQSPMMTPAAQPPPTINENGVISAAARSKNETKLAEQGLTSLYGKNLTVSSQPCSATSTPLPTELCGTSVEVSGQRIPLLFVSEGQINLQLPNGLGPQQIQVVRDGVRSNLESILVETSAPKLFHNFNGLPKATDLAGVAHGIGSGLAVATRGGYFTAYYTDGGRPVGITNPSLSLQPGEPAPFPNPESPNPKDRQLYRTEPPKLALNGQFLPLASIRYSGLTPGFVGLSQINVQLPANLEPGTYRLTTTLNPGEETPLTLLVGDGTPQAGGRLENETGTIGLAGHEIIMDTSQGRRSLITDANGYFLTPMPKDDFTIHVDGGKEYYLLVGNTITFESLVASHGKITRKMTSIGSDNPNSSYKWENGSWKETEGYNTTTLEGLQHLLGAEPCGLDVSAAIGRYPLLLDISSFDLNIQHVLKSANADAAWDWDPSIPVARFANGEENRPGTRIQVSRGERNRYIPLAGEPCGETYAAKIELSGELIDNSTLQNWLPYWLIHEVGHVFMRQHNPSTYSVMFATGSLNAKKIVDSTGRAPSSDIEISSRSSSQPGFAFSLLRDPRQGDFKSLIAGYPLQASLSIAPTISTGNTRDYHNSPSASEKIQEIYQLRCELPTTQELLTTR